MRFFKPLLSMLLMFIVCDSYSQKENWGEQFSDAIIKRYQPNIDVMTHGGWDHSNSIVLHGMEKIYNRNGNLSYLQYIKSFADAFITEEGSIKGLSPALDRIHPGMICLFLYEKTGEAKYKMAATYMRNYLIGTATSPTIFNKTPEGGYWHKNEEHYRQVMTVDGIYMAYPFLVKYGKLFADSTAVNVATFQTLLIASRSFNVTNNLPYHAWDYSKTKPWSNPITGSSSLPWSRSAGWFAMALADMLEYLPSNHKDYKTMLYLFQRLATGIKESQNAADGLWYHVMNAAASPGNYPESSASGMIIYALKKGVNNKWIDSSYNQVSAKAWQGLKGKITAFTDGMPQVISVAPGMGCKNNYEDYVAVRPVACPSSEGKQHSHGYCAVLMAASVMEN